MAMGAFELLDTMTAASYTYFCSVSVFTGLGVQLSVFVCGQMEIQQYSFHVRSPENLFLLPER